MADSQPAREATRTWAPLRNKLFRGLWIATLVSNIGTWMQDVANGWLMTTLAPDPVMVSLVQTANTLPMFLLALPAGALADVVDRRRYLIFTQTWMMLGAAIMAATTLTGHMTPFWLVVGTFVGGLGVALNSPGWHSVTPEIVSRHTLPAAVTLNGLAINGARAIGPALGGLVVVWKGPGAAYLLNSVSYLAVIGVLYNWNRKVRRQNTPAERFFSAMRVGVQHVRHSPWMRSVLIRSGVFVGSTSSLWALLPLLCRQEYHLGPRSYGLMVAMFGVGAVLGATVLLPRMRAAYSVNGIVTRAWLLFVPVLVGLGLARELVLPAVSMLFGGAVWMCILASFHLSAQSVAPPWVRGRAMSVYLLFFFGSASLGSATWGYLAKVLGVREVLLASAAVLLVGSVTSFLAPLNTGEDLSLHPSGHWPKPEQAAPVPHNHGPVMVVVEFTIHADDAAAFRKEMEQIRAIRYQNGVLRWGLFVDIADPAKYREVYLEENWGAHLRQHERVSEYEMEVSKEAYKYHRGEQSPLVYHLAYCDAQFPDVNFDASRQPFDRPLSPDGVPLWFVDDPEEDQDIYTIDMTADGSYTPQA